MPAMNLDLFSALDIKVYDCDKPPIEYLRPYLTTNMVRRAWVPQPIVDAVWVLLEFSSVADRIAWEASLPGDVSRWLSRPVLNLLLGDE